jgi:hypothetical protein
LAFSSLARRSLAMFVILKRQTKRLKTDLIFIFDPANDLLNISLFVGFILFITRCDCFSFFFDSYGVMMFFLNEFISLCLEIVDVVLKIRENFTTIMNTTMHHDHYHHHHHHHTIIITDSPSLPPLTCYLMCSDISLH